MQIIEIKRTERDKKRSRQRCVIDNVYYNLPIILYKKYIRKFPGAKISRAGGK